MQALSSNMNNNYGVGENPTLFLTRASSLHVVGILQRHPDTPTESRSQRERMLPPKAARLENEDLARKVRRCEHVREETQLVHHGVVDTVGAVQADDAGQDGIDTKKARGEWRDLVGCRGLVFEGGRVDHRLQLLD